MNGEFAELLKEIKEWSNEVHGQRHLENLAKFELIFKKLDKLPCERRAGLYTYVKWHLGALTAALVALCGYVLTHLIP